MACMTMAGFAIGGKGLRTAVATDPARLITGLVKQADDFCRRPAAYRDGAFIRGEAVGCAPRSCCRAPTWPGVVERPDRGRSLLLLRRSLLRTLRLDPLFAAALHLCIADVLDMRA